MQTNIKILIPGFFTCCNLLCGCLAIASATGSNPEGLIYASYIVGIAAIFDFLDGTAARILGAYSERGKQLDSLADMVSFGVVPGVILYRLIEFRLTGGIHPAVAAVSLLVPLCSAIRLAKFNTDPRQEGAFRGLPTPANALLICSLPLGFASDGFRIPNYLNGVYPLVVLTAAASLLMVSDLPIFSLKFKNARWKGNAIRYVFMGISLIAFASLRWVSVPLIVSLYVIFSIINNLNSREIQSGN